MVSREETVTDSVRSCLGTKEMEIPIMVSREETVTDSVRSSSQTKREGMLETPAKFRGVFMPSSTVVLRRRLCL